MGWTFLQPTYGCSTPAQAAEQAIVGGGLRRARPPSYDTVPWQDLPIVGRRRVLARSVSLHVAYFAIEDTDLSGGNRKVWAAVCLLGRCPKDPDGYTIGYKDMTEFDGPYYCTAPAKILDLLTPTDNAYALQWRKHGRDRLAALAAKPKATKGCTVVFAEPVRFRNGTELSELTWLGGSVFEMPGTWGNYRVSGWRKRAYTVKETP